MVLVAEEEVTSGRRALFGTWSGRLLLLGVAAAMYVAAVVLPAEIYPLAALLGLATVILWIGRS